MNKPATIKDIARTLNISTSTVSRALRNAHDVNPETRKAVLALSEELAYQPSRLALSLQQQQTHTIGVIVPNLDFMMATMIKGIDEVALEAGYTVMVCQSNESYHRELVNTQRLLDSLVDGFIISVSSETTSFEHFKKIQKKKMPLVFFDRDSSDIAAPRVKLDNGQGGYLAADHLVKQGYRRIAVLAGPRNLSIGNDRMAGALAALQHHGLKTPPEGVVYCNFKQEDAYTATLQLLQGKSRPDAIFAISDRMAIGALLAIREKGLRLPQDIGLVGFNNEPITGLLTPSISSVDQPAFEMGKAAAKLFIAQRNGEEAPENEEIILKPALFIRESSQRHGV